MRVPRSPPGAVLLLLLTSCFGAAPPAEPPTPATTGAPLPSTPESASPPTAMVGDGELAPGDPLCAALGRIVDAEPEGFVSLRASQVEQRQWNGSLIPAGFADCWIEDEPSAGARYLCTGIVLGEGGPDEVVSSYLDLAAAVDACLALPTWYPLSWQRESDEATAAGGHRATWRVAGGGPVLALALDQHPTRQVWLVRLSVGPSDRMAPPQS